MENQPTEQAVEQSTEQTVGQAAGQGSSAQIWYIILAAVVVIGLGLLYFVTKSPVTKEAPTDAQALIEQAGMPALTDGNTTADISVDLNQIQDSSATLDADATAAANDLQSL